MVHFLAWKLEILYVRMVHSSVLSHACIHTCTIVEYAERRLFVSSWGYMDAAAQAPPASMKRKLTSQRSKKIMKPVVKTN